MPIKLSTTLFTSLIISTLLLLFSYPHLTPPLKPSPQPNPLCNLFTGKWVLAPRPTNPYTALSARFIETNGIASETREPKWAKSILGNGSHLGVIDPVGFLGLMRGKRIGFVGDSLNENFVVGLLCVLWKGDGGGRKWKRKGAWRGAFFPRFNVTVGYHRAVLLAKYEFQSNQSDQNGLKGINRVDVDIPAAYWADITDFYDVLVFNTGHWWNLGKFSKETPLVFYEGGHPIIPPLGILDGLKVVLANMVSHIENKVPRNTLKFWRLQSPRHFFGGDWNQNGRCLFDNPLEEAQHPNSLTCGLIPAITELIKRPGRSIIDSRGGTRDKYPAARSHPSERVERMCTQPYGSVNKMQLQSGDKTVCIGACPAFQIHGSIFLQN